jgi:hypothetical protein
VIRQGGGGGGRAVVKSGGGGMGRGGMAVVAAWDDSSPLWLTKCRRAQLLLSYRAGDPGGAQPPGSHGCFLHGGLDEASR